MGKSDGEERELRLVRFKWIIMKRQLQFSITNQIDVQ